MHMHVQDQERELLQQGYETLQVLEAERIADLLKAGTRVVVYVYVCGCVKQSALCLADLHRHGKGVESHRRFTAPAAVLNMQRIG